MKILNFALLITCFVGVNAELTKQDLAPKLNVSLETAAQLIERITYIDRINTNHAPYYPILSEEFLKKRNYKVGCEVGVFTAGHAAFILANTNVETLYCVDSYRAPMQGSTIITEGFEKNLWQACWDTIFYYAQDKLSFFGNRAKFIRSPSEQAAATLADECLDFVFIDGDHSYAGALADFRNYFGKVRSGGIIAGDDYQIEDVRRAANEFFGQKNLTINIYAGQERFWWIEKP